MSVRLVVESVFGNPGNRGQWGRKSLAALAWQVRKRVSSLPRELRLPNDVRFNAYPDCVVSSALIYADWPEYHGLMRIRSMLRPGDIVLDVGAYVGHMSLLVADIAGPSNLFAFEPAPTAFERLSENWRLNGWSTDCLFQTAVGDRSGTAFVRDAQSPDTTSSVLKEEESRSSVEVSMTPLDDLRSHWKNKSVGLLKIDVEGFEEHVFRGGQTLLQQDRPRLVMFESLSETINPDIATLLRECSYTVFQLDAEGRPDFEDRTAQNLFAIPEENKKKLM